MDFNPLFYPESMAVIGVSLTHDRHPANVIFSKNLLRYPVRIYGVNPKGGVYMGQKIYKAISDVPERVDLAVIAVKADVVPVVLEQCIAARVGGAVIISGGFAETGRAELQRQCTSMAKRAGFPFVGPNCLGIYIPSRVDTLFLPTERIIRPEVGNVALVSQSGGVLVDQMLRFAEEDVGLSIGISIGNKAVIRETDLIDYLGRHEPTRVIVFYIEGFGENEGRRFVHAAWGCPKPVIVLKSGKSSRGALAVSSHTAALAGDYAVFSACLSQFGVIEAKSESELVAFCEALSCYQKSIIGKIAIVTGSGGHGALAVDLCSKFGLGVPGFSNELRERIRQRLSTSIRSIASLANPLDLTGSAVDDDFVEAVAELSRNEEVDCILLLLLPYLPGITADIGARLSAVYRREGKPLIAYVPHEDKYMMIIEGFELNGIPVAPSVESSILMASALKRCQVC